MNKTNGVGAAIACLVAALLAISNGVAQESSDPDADYVARFLKMYKKVEPAPSFEEYVSPARYDALYMGERLTKRLEKVSNDEGGIAWGLAYEMMALNDMFRATKDAKYLEANVHCVRAVVAARDDKLGVTLWTGVVAPAWGAEHYAERGRAVFAVHTGMITYPILDCLFLLKEAPEVKGRLGEEYEVFLRAAEEALAYHNRQWRDGPAAGEGHYIGMDQENVCEGKPLPGNRLSAMGRALWTSWKLTGNTVHRDRARALGTYIKNRLTLAPDGAYYWPYWLPADPVTTPASEKPKSGEDTSHGTLTAELPFMLAAEGEVFTAEDMKRMANTLLKGFGRLGGGIFLGDVVGNAASKPDYVSSVARWLVVARWVPEVREPIVAFYLNYEASPSPYNLASLLLDAKCRGQL